MVGGGPFIVRGMDEQNITSSEKKYIHEQT